MLWCSFKDLENGIVFFCFRPKASESKAEDLPPPKSSLSVADSANMRFVSAVPFCVFS